MWKIQEIDDARRGVGNERRGEPGGSQQRLGEVAQDRSHARHLGGLLGERERRGLDDVLVGAIGGAEQRLEGAIEAEILHVLVDLTLGAVEGLGERAIDRLERGRRGERALEVARQHRQRPAHQISDVVGEVAVVAVDERLLAKIRVETEDALAEQEVAEGVVAVLLDHRARRDHIAEAL